MKLNMVFIALVDISAGVGAPIHVKELVTNWQKTGIEVHLFAFANQKKYRDPEINHFHNLGYLHQKRSFLQIFWLMFSFLKILVLPKKYVARANLLYSRDEGFEGILLLLLKALWNRKIKTVYEKNGLSEEEFLFHGTFWDRMYLPLYLFLENLVLKRVDAIIAVTQEIKEVLTIKREVSNSKIHVVSNGVAIDKFYHMDRGNSGLQELARKLHIMPDDFVIGYIGGLVWWQGVDYLISVAPLVAKEIPNVKVLIVGSGNAEKELKKLASASGMNSSFIFTGTVPHDEVSNYINLCQVCVVLKREASSGFSPLKLYEYLACGKPVITSNFAGFEIVTRNKMGLLVNPEDSNELARSILKLFQDESLREQMGKNGRGYVVQNCSWAATAEKVLSVCQSLSPGRGKN